MMLVCCPFKVNKLTSIWLGWLYLSYCSYKAIPSFTVRYLHYTNSSQTPHWQLNKKINNKIFSQERERERIIKSKVENVSCLVNQNNNHPLHNNNKKICDIFFQMTYGNFLYLSVNISIHLQHVNLFGSRYNMKRLGVF